MVAISIIRTICRVAIATELSFKEANQEIRVVIVLTSLAVVITLFDIPSDG